MPEQPGSSSTDSRDPAGPVGQGEYVVRQGDCMGSIADQHGFFWQTLWNLAENAELKRVRRDASVLLPGDHVTIPDVRLREEERATGASHRFRRRGVPAMLRLRLMEPERQPRSGEGPTGSEEPAAGQAAEDGQPRQRPRANVRYVLIVAGRRTEGTTDDRGRIECAIPPGARNGRLILNPGTNPEEVIPLRLGHMDPVTVIAGVRKRLRNLGFRCGEGDEMTRDLEDALSEFQRRNSLEVTGQLDQATRDKLMELHGT